MHAEKIILFAGSLFCVISTAFPHIPIQLTSSPLPSAVDNSANQYFRPIFSQQGYSCGNANGVSYTFTYEQNAARGLRSNVEANQYPYCYTYHFLNDGSGNNGTSHMYVDAWTIIRENGIMNTVDFGGFANGYPTRWMSGYALYYRAMHNRVDRIDSISMFESNALTRVRQWLFDHGNGSTVGGICNFGIRSQGKQLVPIVSGPEAGKNIMRRYGTSGDHAQTVVGYNDSIRFDFNNDGRFTNTIDITGDNQVTMADWEIGALKMADSHGTTSGDLGFYYCPYRLLVMNEADGGIKNGNRVCFITVRKDYAPRMALKVSLTHSQRNNVALSMGIAAEREAVSPSKTRKFSKQFSYAGGAYPICGSNQSATIEIGIDVTDLLDSLPGTTAPTFFLIVDSKGGSGTVNSLSLMDYTGGTVRETRSTPSNVVIASGKTVVLVASSGTAPVRRGKQRDVESAPDFRRINGVTCIKLPFASVRQVSLFNMKGDLVAIRKQDPDREWIPLPAPASLGVMVVKAKCDDGKTWTGTIPPRFLSN
ncbi:MAG: hypothetical protein JXA71_16160 [Chitinispirillaceae bacterium]|nr:hypothetical protein [Chitinispirillaceae bacterium]